MAEHAAAPSGTPTPGAACWPAASCTGHRPQHLTQAQRHWVRAELDRVTAKLAGAHGTTRGNSGMAIGADMWWADALLRRGLDLWAHVPFPQQPDRWSTGDQAEWARVKAAAARVVVYGDNYDVALLHERNDGLLDDCDVLVAVWRPSKRGGGTASAVGKAARRGLPIIHLNPDDCTTRLPGPAYWQRQFPRQPAHR